MELHDRLKAAREDADLTQAQVAEQTALPGGSTSATNREPRKWA